MPPSKKNKRGARASVEEETSAAKRYNMAVGKVDARNEESEEQTANLKTFIQTKDKLYNINLN